MPGLGVEGIMNVFVEFLIKQKGQFSTITIN